MPVRLQDGTVCTPRLIDGTECNAYVKDDNGNWVQVHSVDTWVDDYSAANGSITFYDEHYHGDAHSEFDFTSSGWTGLNQYALYRNTNSNSTSGLVSIGDGDINYPEPGDNIRFHGRASDFYISDATRLIFMFGVDSSGNGLGIEYDIGYGYLRIIDGQADDYDTHAGIYNNSTAPSANEFYVDIDWGTSGSLTATVYHDDQSIGTVSGSGLSAYGSGIAWAGAGGTATTNARWGGAQYID